MSVCTSGQYSSSMHGVMGVTFYVTEITKLLRDEPDFRRRTDKINDLLMSRTDTTDIITAMTIVIAASEPDARTLTNR